MINLKPVYKNIVSCTLYLSLAALPLVACSAGIVEIKNHPINEVVEKNKNLHAVPIHSAAHRINQMRIMHIDIDYIYDKDKQQQQDNIEALLKRINLIQPNTIFLQAFADPDANGSADQVYFKNRHIPVRDNLFPRLLSQIRSKTKVQQVYAWLPLMAWEFPRNNQLSYVSHTQGGKSGYIRVSPFEPKNLNYVADIFLDFLQDNAVDGILYHDDITLSDYEDASPAAQKMYQAWGFNAKQLLNQPNHPQQTEFAQFKTAYLDQFAAGITKILKQQHPQLLTARNMYAPVVLNPQSENWFSQSMPSTYQYYDYNAIMAMPYMEEATNHQQFYLDLIERTKKYDPYLDRTVFELQAVNWRNNQKIPTQELIDTITLLKKHGVKHIGYYPDDFASQHPDANTLKSVFSNFD